MEYNKQIRNNVFDGNEVSPILPYDSLYHDRETAQQIAKGNGKISLSGVQPKFSMVIDKGMLRLSKEGEQGRYILKPAPVASFILDREFCPANEYLTMCIASQVFGIKTAPCCLCWFRNGTSALLVRRFDIKTDGTKIHQEDFAQLAGLNKQNAGENFKYDSISYEECADIIRKYVNAASAELLKFFRMIVFNYIVSNDDAHIKNFSLIEQNHSDFVLTPAYDMMNTAMHLATPGIFALRKGLFREGMIIDDTHNVNRSSFVEFGKRIGLPEKVILKELDNFTKEKNEIEQMVCQSSLSDSLKDFYIKTLKYRQNTLL